MQRPAILILEGKLTSQWINELIRVVNDMLPLHNCIFDIENVSYVDPFGEQTLSWLHGMGAFFLTDTLSGKDLCRRLHLRRIPRAQLQAPQRIEPSAMMPDKQIGSYSSAMISQPSAKQNAKKNGINHAS